MSNYPPNNGPPPANPLPYPDRQRPAKPQQQQQQQYGYAPAELNTSPTTATGGGLPYPDRPAKYSDYQQQSSAQPPYRQDSAPYRPPQQQEAPKAKPVAAEAPASTGKWPTPPAAFSTDDAPPPPKPPKVASFSENVGGGNVPYTSAGPYAMGSVAAALPTSTSPPPPPPPPPPPQAAPYQSQYQGSVYDKAPPPPPVSASPQPIPPYMDPKNQYAIPPPPSTSPVYQGGQGGSTGVAPIVTGAALGAAAVHSYSSPQSPITGPGSPFSQQPYTQSTSPSPAAQYQPTQFDQKTKPPSTSPPIQGAQYAPTPTMGPPTTGPPGPPFQGQSPPPQYATVNTNPQQTGYMSGPPPAPGVTPSSSFPPPPPTFRPSQYTGVPPHAGQIHNMGSVYIDGKEHPIPAFTHTIQTPSQCDPVLKEAYFGPYLRFTNVDLQRNLWLGSILLIVPSNLPPPRLEFHQSGNFTHLQSAVPQCIYSYDNYSFYRYDLVMPIFPHEQKWTYAITTQGTQIWEFTIAGQQQQWRFIAWSCNDFSASVKQEERDKLGFGTLWKDVMDRYSSEGAFHAQLGGGDQIYADRMWKDIPFLIEWLAIKGKEQRQHWPWKKEHEEVMRHAYFYYYTHAFSRPHFRDALARIPHLFQIDDHDIFDGYGSYPHYLQQSQVFQGIGKVAFEFYLIFQHHTTQQWLYQHPDPNDLITATGMGWSFVKYFGPSTVILGLDTRAERDKHRIMSQESYNAVFNRLRQVPPTVVHCVVMLAVPIVYPRLEAVEKALTGVAVAKKGVNGAFNLLGKAVTTITPKGSATQETNSAFGNVKKAFGKSGLMSSVVSKFGEVDLLDDLLDHWTHAHHDKERTMVIRTLQEIAFNRRIRVTVVSGDVHCCGVGYLYDPASPQDHKLMYQIITSAIVNIPPPGMVIKLLHNNDKLFVPPMNSAQSTKMPSDTKEEMMELFAKDVDGKDLGTLRKLLPRRNYSICKGGDAGSEVWEICVERGRGSETVKYGPIVIPRLQ